MAKKGDKQPDKIEGNLNDPHSLGSLAKAFLESMLVKNFSEHTVNMRRLHLNRFIIWAADRSVTQANEVTRPMVERYQKHLFYYRNDRDRPLGFRAQHSHLVSLRSWMKWLARRHHILYNPAAELELPRIGSHLPKNVLNPDEAETVLNQCDVKTLLGLRDRAIMELFYSTGIRRAELAELQIYHVDMTKRTVLIRQGKGKKDRIVPLGKRAALWLTAYLEEVRPQLMIEHHNTLFVTKDGEFFSTQRLSDLVRRYVKQSGIAKQGGCHLFRHSMATSMLENGADIRFIQAMLGHASLETTEIYTRVGIKKLQQIHDATHPAEASSSSDDSSSDESSSDSVSDDEAA